MALTGDWSLWRDFAIRSSGFPVEGLEAFGPGEDTRLAAVARDPAFREAVAWQSRESLASCRGQARGRRARRPVAQAPPPGRRRAAIGSATAPRTTRSGSSGRWRGARSARQGEAIAVRSGALERERVVHFETWAVEAVAAAAGVTTPLPMGPFPERAFLPLPAGTSPGSSACRPRAPP